MDNSGWNRPAFGIFHPLTAILVLIAGFALALWPPRLDQRPMHNDEAVNGIKFGQLWEHGGYKYDPNEHHGPSLYYATLALSRLTGAPADFDRFTESRLRLTTVVFGVGLILLLLLVATASANAPRFGLRSSRLSPRQLSSTAGITSTKSCWSSLPSWPSPPAGVIRAAGRLAGRCWLARAWVSCTRPRRPSSSL